MALNHLLKKHFQHHSKTFTKFFLRKVTYDPSQQLFLQEKCIVVDVNDNIKGWKSKGKCHEQHSGGPHLHRAFSVFLFNQKNQLLMHRRSGEKIIFPGYYTNSCCSHPLYDIFETQEQNQLGVKNAARRRLNFELGIPYHQVLLTDLKFITRIQYQAQYNDLWGECEIDYILFLRIDADLNINANEISEVQYVSREEMPNFIKDCEKHKIPISHWFKIIYENYLDEWWKNIDHIEKFQDNIIHRHC